MVDRLEVLCDRRRSRAPGEMLMRQRSRFASPFALFADGSVGAWYDPSDLSSMFQDAAGTIHVTGSGDPVGLIQDKSGNGHHAFQDTNNDFRPTLQQDDSGDWILQNDEIDDALAVTFPNMGTDCTVAYVTQSEVRLDEGVTLNGAYTLPQNDLLGFVAIDRELTTSEKIGTILYLASKAQGVNYGASIDDMTLACLNAVDVFVYDTSKDSDGGAWRKRTQHTSWYNETLNTATRGSRREFPAVAVIVAETNKVTIYDGDDPSLPMWMVFNNGASNLIGNSNISGVTVVNGHMTLSLSTGGWGMCEIRFVADNGNLRWTNGILTYLGNIAERNDGAGRSSASGSADGIVNLYTNDVAMTVLPDAPIDSATGLPVPTIAVATNGGVSVIKDDGTVVDIVYSGSPAITSVDATPERMIFSAANGVVFASGYPTTDVSSSSFSTLAGLLPDGAGYYSTAIPSVLGTVSKVAA